MLVTGRASGRVRRHQDTEVKGATITHAIVINETVRNETVRNETMMRHCDYRRSKSLDRIRTFRRSWTRESTTKRVAPR